MGAPNVVLEDITENAEAKVARYAAICYNSKTDEESNERRIKNLLRMGHLATLRFASATFTVSNITRVCSHQFVRSKHLDFLQQSQRYVSQSDVAFTTPIGVLKNQELLRDYSKHVADGFVLYDKLIGGGVKKEDARFVLPECTNTKLVVTGNFQAWRDFLRLRDDVAAQWEIREVAQKIRKELVKHAPNIFGE